MDTIKEYELSTLYNNRSSFYGKAKIIIEGNKTTLKSYNTDVAYIIKDNNSLIKAIVKGTYSCTTVRHIKEFLLQHGFKADNKTQILKDYLI